jgi:hypothetical protein
METITAGNTKPLAFVLTIAVFAPTPIFWGGIEHQRANIFEPWIKPSPPPRHNIASRAN